MAEREVPPFRELFGIGTLLLILTLFPGWAPTGPWGEESFTRGIFGLIGASMIYVGWYRYTFKKNGLIPVLSMWKEPTKSIQKLVGIFWRVSGYFLETFGRLFVYFLDT